MNVNYTPLPAGLSGQTHQTEAITDGENQLIGVDIDIASDKVTGASITDVSRTNRTHL